MTHSPAPLPPITVPVVTRGGSYHVVIGQGLAASLPAMLHGAALAPPRSLFIVRDAGVPAATIEAVTDSLARAGYALHQHAIEVSESNKSIDELRHLLIAMASAGLHRGDALVALGGGIVGDMGGFAAAIYQRGIRFIQMPTTLLSMVDASVGGKTGVNLRVPSLSDGDELRKNFVGAFHQPAIVAADVGWLATLPPRHFRAGLAECVKHGLLSAAFHDPLLLDWTRQHLPAFQAGHATSLAELVARNVAIKARVVELDERESLPNGGRMLLNLGHTFGHAIETIDGLSPDADPANAPLHHGEAVALGLIAATATGVSLGLTPPGLLDTLRSLLRQISLPTSIRHLPTGPALLERMFHDKKVMSGKLRLIIPVGAGVARVIEGPSKEAIFAGWDAIRAVP